jgi:hypothetical protein
MKSNDDFINGILLGGTLTSLILILKAVLI